MRVKLIAVILLCLTLSDIGSAFGEKENGKLQIDKQYKIIFSKFENSSAGQYASLRDSVQAMLASRLSARDRVSVLEKTFSAAELKSLKNVDQQKPFLVSGEQVDYLVTGALFSLTSGLEIQVDLYPLVSGGKVLQFSVRSQKTDTLIADVEQLSAEIAQKVFGERVTDSSGKYRKEADIEGDTGFVTAHPEAAYKRNVYTGSLIGIAGSGVTTKGRGGKMTLTVPFDMTAMAVGDITGDGVKEMLVLAGRKLRLYNTKEHVIHQIGETDLPWTITVHAMNLADLDGDGKEEIYLSGTDGLYVASSIMQYDSPAGFKVLASNIPWYLRPLFVPGKGWLLAGQQRGIEKIELARAGVYQLTLDKEYKLSKGERIPLPKAVNLFDFVYADLDGDGFNETAVVDQHEKLRIYSPSNELMWISKKNFAGSTIYLGPKRGGATSKNNRRNFTPEEDSDRDLIFVPNRLIVTDIDKDGKEEIIISEGTKIGLSAFNKLRLYDSGAIVSMVWNGSELTESWRTGNYRGYLAGYDFTLLNDSPQPKETKNDTGEKSLGRLYIGHLPKSGTLADLLPGGAETELVVYDLEFSNERAKK